MERSLFSFIWKYSLPQQFVLLGITILSFPFLYASLELPKLIINDAISSDGPIELWGRTFTQIEYLAVLSGGFLLVVLASGMIKMYLNIRKGVVAERLLRRFRYQLISRILRFPLPYFRRTSQGELVSMVTAEAEPLGGIMGDALAHPVFQAGQMLTILTFLFIQSVWLGLAAIALIPLQAWLIPLIQRQINLLNKARIKEVRRLAENMSDNIGGVEDLRANGGVPYSLASYTERLGRLFDIRFAVYRKKFFMKFLNNFINQLTPFFFLSIGGYLAIKGELTVGALVAALAAYKDLSAPWRELLAYYNRVQDMSLRYQTVVEQFAPEGMVDATLFEGVADHIPRLKGSITLQNASVREMDGQIILDQLTAVIPAGSSVAIKSTSSLERRALMQLLSRGILPSSGFVLMDDTPITELHQSVLAARVGVVSAAPYLFNRTIGENVKLPLLSRPKPVADPAPEVAQALEEARITGNSLDVADMDWGGWFAPEIAGLEDDQAYVDWWFQIIEAIEMDDFLFNLGLTLRCEPQNHQHLAKRIVELRPEIQTAIAAAGLEGAYYKLDKSEFNPGLAVGGNLLFALARKPLKLDDITRDERFIPALAEFGLKDELESLAGSLFSVILRTFKNEPSHHPLIQRMGLDAETFDDLRIIYRAFEQKGFAGLDAQQTATVLALPFIIAAEQIGPAFPKELKQRIVKLRHERMQDLRGHTLDFFVPLDIHVFSEGLTVFENAIFGKIRTDAGQDGERLKKLVGDILRDHDLTSEVARLIWNLEAGIGGSKLTLTAHERVGFVRAFIKRPDIVIMDRPLPSASPETRKRLRARTRALLPEATLIFLDEDFHDIEAFDMALELKDCCFVSNLRTAREEQEEESASADMNAKIRVLETAPDFQKLTRAQLRILAFASHWFTASAGEAIFKAGDITTGAFLLKQGIAEIRLPDTPEDAPSAPSGPNTEVHPGRLIGDISVILDRTRHIDLIAKTKVKGLRIGAGELRDIIRSDVDLAATLLTATADNLTRLSKLVYDVREQNRELEMQIKKLQPASE